MYLVVISLLSVHVYMGCNTIRLIDGDTGDTEHQRVRTSHRPSYIRFLQELLFFGVVGLVHLPCYSPLS